MSIKLLALDLDGTLLDSEKKMPVDFLPWVREHSEVRTVIASGRQYYTILRDFPVGRDNITIIAENGGLVFDENNVFFSSFITIEFPVNIIFFINHFFCFFRKVHLDFHLKKHLLIR